MIPVLARLDPSCNGVNRFISTSQPFKQSLTDYRWYRHSARVCTVDEAVRVSKTLVKDTLVLEPSKPCSSAAQFSAILAKVFAHPENILGAASLVQGTVSDVQSILEERYRRQLPLEFTLLGYPHKMPNPLYTLARLPDMAELVSLEKLSMIAESLSRAWPYGVRFRVLTENSIFASMSDISDEEHRAYFRTLCSFVEVLGRADLISVEDIVQFHTPALEESWRSITQELRSQYEAGVAAARDMVDSVLPTNFMTLNYRAFAPELLAAFFDPEVKDPAIEELREKKYKRALEESFAYLAYHQARYRLGFNENAFPSALKLTVAPKRGSFGVNVFHKGIRKLPYYGYIVCSPARWDLEYLIDVPAEARAVYLQGVTDSPFFYEL